MFARPQSVLLGETIDTISSRRRVVAKGGREEVFVQTKEDVVINH